MQDQPAVGLVFWVTVGVLLIALPNLFSVIVLLLAPGLIDLRERRRWLGVLAGIVIVIGILGYIMGVYNELFLTCYDFQVSGNDLPERCKTPE